MLSTFSKNFLFSSFSQLPKNSFTLPKKLLPKTIFFDYQSTTPVAPEVLQSMLPYFNKKFGNAHSTSHSYGWEAMDAVKKARKNIADLINCKPSEIIFTSGATESNNLAIKGLIEFYKNKNHIITTQIEHKCILNTCRYLESLNNKNNNQKYKITYLPVNKKGIINIQDVINNITPKTLLLSTIFVNNEIGVIQPIKQLGKICKKNKIFFHTDAAQAFGKIPIDVQKLNIDLLSISAHKIYGPKGIGALFVRKFPKKVKLLPQIHGGGQERGLRSGTLNVPLIVGFGEAAKIAKIKMFNDYIYIKMLFERLLKKLKNNLKNIYVNGSLENNERYFGNLNVSFEFVEGESLMMKMKNVAVSSGSACTSASLEPSYVLHAIGVNDDLAHTSLRIGIGRYSTIEEIDILADSIIKAVNELREMSPLWEMKKQGIDLSKINWAKH